MNFIKDSCIRIPKNHNDTKFINAILSKLTRKSQQYGNVELIEIKKYYDETDTEYMIPRFFPIEKFGYQSNTVIGNGQNISINSNITPRNLIQKNALSWFENNNYGILCMKPGEGKTVVTIEAICRLGKKSIIFVHKNDLGKQWIERIEEHTELSSDRIGWLRSSTYQSDLNKPIVISTVQTFCSLCKNNKFIEQMKQSEFGIAVWDECHTSVSAEMFSKSSLNTPTLRTYGLSATPERADGNTDIMTLHLGKVHQPIGDTNTLTPKVIVINFDFEIMKKYKYTINQLYLKNDNRNKGLFNKAVYLSKLIKSNNLISCIKQVVQKIIKSNRNALILSDRINILESSMTGISNDIAGLFIADTKDDRTQILNKQIIFSTYQMSRDGLDVPRLDCIVFCTPVSNIEQAAGRILREFRGKSQPVIIDLLDTGCEDMIKRSKYRMRFYTSKQWQIEEKHFRKD